MSGDTTQVPTLTVGGKIYAGWMRLSVTRQIDQMVSKFSIGVAERWTGQADPWQITPGSPCTIMIGKDLVLTGYVDAYRPQFGRETHDVEIIGRSKTEDIVDCTPDIAGGQFSGYKLDAIARAIASLYGIVVVVQTDVGDPFADATIQKNETGFAYLERLARLRSVLLADDPQGRLLLTRAGGTSATDPLVQGQNIERLSAELNMAKRFSVYDVKTQVGVQQTNLHFNSINTPPTPVALPATGGYSQRLADAQAFAAAFQAPQTQAVETISGKAYDHGVTRFRPHVVFGEGALTAAQAQARAVWQAKHDAARGTELSIDVAGWRQSDGTLWTCNTLVTVTSAWAQVDAQLLIAGLEYVLDPHRGRITRLRVGPVDGYQPDPGQVKVRKPKGGPALTGFHFANINTVP